MPNAGWLKVGLWLIHRDDPRDPLKGTNELFRITKIVREFVELEGLNPGSTGRTKIEYLHQFYQAPSFFECDDCQRKPGSPTLCADCLHRRTQFSISGDVKCELPRFCSRAYLKYPEGYLPMECPTQKRPKVIPNRYHRKWVI